MKATTKVLVIGAVCCAAAGMDTAHADSLFNKRVAESGTLISAQKQRFEVGDFVTVLVREAIDAETMSDTDTKKESDVGATASAAANAFLLKDSGSKLGFLDAADLPNYSLQHDGEFKTNGKTARGNSLTMTVTCVVTEVLANGNIMLEGEKVTTVNREKSKIKIAGMVRARDVGTDNTVSSNQMAGATIQLTGEGPLWNNQRRGFFTKFFDFISPF